MNIREYEKNLQHVPAICLKAYILTYILGCIPHFRSNPQEEETVHVSYILLSGYHPGNSQQQCLFGFNLWVCITDARRNLKLEPWNPFIVIHKEIQGDRVVAQEQ